MLVDMLTLVVRSKINVHTPAKVTRWLAVEVTQDTINPNVQQVVARMRDPRCRFMYAQTFLMRSYANGAVTFTARTREPS
jgi:hypothetical protein